MTERTKLILIAIAGIAVVILFLLFNKGMSQKENEVELTLQSTSSDGNLLSLNVASTIASSPLTVREDEIKAEGALCLETEFALGSCQLEIGVGGYIIGKDSMGSTVVHLVDYSPDQKEGTEKTKRRYELMVVKPDENSLKKYPLYETQRDDYSSVYGVDMIDENHVVFTRRMVEHDRLVYDVAVLDMENGVITMSPHFGR
ncbi:hypothetical protein [Paenibacillus sp. L3-i20]|uniref:hypothetical protein n=1 Tax=Paenibacillus sp. L3-i20 TaxID=2905833 RepID=UPI001EDF9437|nr:hypothetical protein [Paenibacillus sp. L3-i20]GKU77747.1 hypothetical protein L3i20_v221440 [Paenibacillus sp. L3-i20]